MLLWLVSLCFPLIWSCWVKWGGFSLRGEQGWKFQFFTSAFLFIQIQLWLISLLINIFHLKSILKFNCTLKMRISTNYTLNKLHIYYSYRNQLEDLIHLIDDENQLHPTSAENCKIYIFCRKLTLLKKLFNIQFIFLRWKCKWRRPGISFEYAWGRSWAGKLPPKNHEK